MNVIPLNISELIVSVKELRQGHKKFLKELRDLHVICTIVGIPVVEEIKISMQKTFIQKCNPDFDRKFNEILADHVMGVKTVIIKR